MNRNDLLSGDELSVSKALTVVESDRVAARSLIGSLPEREYYVIGITGSSGAGKSTLVNWLSVSFSDASRTAVLAIDPSSPFKGGAFLGDRIRMNRASRSGKILIRSMASRGMVGGLSPSVFDAVELLGRCGYHYIIVETVGVGQAETDIVNLSDVVVLVLAPGIGDEIQMMKAGIMEIGDIYTVNKMDIHGADQLANRIRSVLDLADVKREIVKTNSLTGTNVDRLYQLLIGELNRREKSGKIEESRQRRREIAELNTAFSALKEAHSRGVKLEAIMECINRLREDG
ncbi:MAG TPA: methylmalonyl Co-A mutase-associated GTPase MeaB [Kosmotogaceae bacterium]|nr:MAG: LAO/AO transport system ATPase [Thermotogales bacterium 46_20]HAA85196.1 methylmalonyl Co-A mutase-associated GTPase MeaB [Kosmotogaceae bacterium]